MTQCSTEDPQIWGLSLADSTLWDVNYSQMAEICDRSISTVNRWFSVTAHRNCVAVSSYK
ncbi:hypothetical protein [Microseira sp. BLCC-F43]|uniref:hypothetical protein n=1 Tax=Microseira sp. BLCC-F43 TaxID=3153602 RepID=UPI0035BC0FB1